MKSFEPFLLPGLWAIWLIYWIVAALGAKQTKRLESGLSQLSHLVPVVFGGVLLGAPDFLGDFLQQRFLPQTAAWFWIGTALTAAGLGFSIVARIWLGRNWSGLVTLKQGHELIRIGPYAWVRHPIYTGLLLALIGTAIAVGKWRALLGLALIIVGVVRKIGIEERFLSEQFGDDYKRYRAEVPALVPYLL
jgi:protein-S-isoprenylcysteine O-methyltransferase Ste14